MKLFRNQSTKVKVSGDESDFIQNREPVSEPSRTRLIRGIFLPRQKRQFTIEAGVKRDA